MVIYHIPLDNDLCIISVHNITIENAHLLAHHDIGCNGYSSLITYDQLIKDSPLLYAHLSENTTNIKSQPTTLIDVEIADALRHDMYDEMQHHMSVFVFNETTIYLSTFNTDEIYHVMKSLLLGFKFVDKQKLVITSENLKSIPIHHTVTRPTIVSAIKKLNRQKLLNSNEGYYTTEKLFEVLIDNDVFGLLINTILGHFNIIRNIDDNDVYMIDSHLIEKMSYRWHNSSDILNHPSIIMLFTYYIVYVVNTRPFSFCDSKEIDDMDVGYNLQLQYKMINILGDTASD